MDVYPLEAVMRVFNVRFPVGCECWYRTDGGAVWTRVMGPAEPGPGGVAVARFEGLDGPRLVWPGRVWSHVERAWPEL